MDNLKSFAKKRLERKIFTGLPLTILVLVFLILIATLYGLTDSIVNSAPITKIDSSLAQYLYHIRNHSLIILFYFITYLGNQFVILLLAIIFGSYLYFKKELAYLFSLFVVFFGTEGSVFLIKIFISRARPGADISYYLEQSKSFPSFHAAISAVLFGFLVYYLIHHIKEKYKKSLVILAGTLVILLVGFSRLYLVVHYLSDVLGGFLIGGIWLVLGITLRERHFYMSTLNKGKTNLS